MSLRPPGPAAQAAALREEFDRTFATAPPVAAGARERFIGIRVGGDAFALRLAEIAGLHADRPIVAVPGPSPTLMGLASFRGAMVPVHDLQALLGYPPGAKRRWLILARAERPVALAFDQLDGYFEADADARIDTEDTSSHHTRGATRTANLVRAIVSIDSVLDTLRRKDRGRDRAASSPAEGEPQ